MVIDTVLVGLGATAMLDLWTLARWRWLGTPIPNYGLVGRWLGHMPRGRFRHAAIQRADAVRGERWIGWIAHYLIGIGFAALLPMVADPGWLQRPTLIPALAIGVATVAAPFLLMQPGMGAGLAARHTADPVAARMQSLVTHAVFGFALYAAGYLVQRLTAA